MLFSSGFFLFAFLPAFLLIYFLAGRRGRNPVLLAGSLLFYAWAEPVFVFWALGSALLDYVLGGAIYRSTNVGRRKLYVAIGVVANLSLLCWFKYANFAVENLSALSSWAGLASFSLVQIALPIAISFIVFEKITYVVDIYRGTGRPAGNLLLYLLYVFYFPKLLAGPIIRYCDIEKQLTEHNANFADVRDGLVRFVYGLGKKVWLADSMGQYVDQVFGLPADKVDFSTAWLGVLSFTLQIYFDFSGYSDMALGLSRVFGFRLNENFRMPYLAQNFTEFWRRWHISLSTWIREYLYIPLGGSRGSTGRTYVNLCIAFLLSGIWHGAAWPFIVWGIFHGVMLVADRLFWANWQQRLPRLVNVGTTFFLVMISWVIFRSHTFPQMAGMLETLFTPWRAAQFTRFWFTGDLVCLMSIGYALVFLPQFAAFTNWRTRYQAWPLRHEAELVAVVILLFTVIGKIATETFTPFLYFRF